ncbi:hypothetical protein [Acinetobacter sp.]|uniref:hypothetical protein n=1 Tax=Acinetobacter sp. TaxID=472 RepID=UPI003CFD83DE
MLPRITRTLLDGNLERASGNQKVNRRILILGTSEDGPVYDPIDITDINHAQEVFGRIGQGTLVRSVKEAIDAQEGSGGVPQISAVRLGDKYAKKAYLDILSGGETVLTLEALYPGDTYNDISIVQTANEIKIYNPKTEVYSVFTYNINPANTTVDAHNVSELADAINADPNLNEILVADAIEKDLHYEIEVNSTDDSDVLEKADGGSTIINLSKIVAGDFAATRLIDGGDNTGTADDVSKTVTAVSMVYAVGESGVVEQKTNGLTKITLSRMPIDGKSDSRFDTIMSVTTASGTFHELTKDATSTDIAPVVGGEAYLRYRNAYLGKIEVASDAVDAALTLDAPWGIAHDNTVGTAVALDKWGIADAGVVAKLQEPVAAVVDASNGWAFSTATPFKLEFRPYGASANDWSHFALETGEYSLGWSGDVLSITITDAGKLTQLKALNGGDLRISFDSMAGFMEEKSSLTTLESLGAVFSDYFVRGKEIIFGAPVPANLVFRYATIQYYELGSTLEIEDASIPKLRLIGSGIQPGPGGAAIGLKDVILGFKYTVSPEMFSISTAAFSNGTNGLSLRADQIYEELSEAYNRLDDQSFDILCVPGAYLDSTKTTYNPITGLPQEGNAEFHVLMNEFLSAYNGEAIGIVGFKPIKGTGINGTITRLDVSSRVEKLTETDLTDPLRAANFLTPFSSIYMLAVDVEPVFALSGSLYASTGEAWVAGHLSTLAPNESIYLDAIPGALGMRYGYSEKLKDGRSQLDALSDSRIIAGIKTTNGVRLTDGPLLAAPGSDYERLTTYWIVKEAMRITRAIAGDYLGRPSSTEILQSMETRLKTDLNTMVPKYLQAFNFKIKSDAKQRVLGQVEILLILVPVFEIRDIRVPVILSADDTTIA